MRSLLSSVSVLVLMMLAGLSNAQTLPDLYQAQVPVIAGGSAPDPAQVRAGLERVLVKVTGQVNPDRQPALDVIREQAQQLLDQASLQNGQWLLSYRASTLNALLMQAGISRVAADRPRLLVWLGDQPASGEYRFARATDPLWQTVRQGAQARGLPLAEPSPGIQPQLLPSQLWQFEAEPLWAAARRYQADAILVGVPVKGRMNWQLFTRSQVFTLADTERAPAAVSQVINQVADTLLPLAGEETFTYQRPGLMVEISGVADLYDFRGVLNTLEQSPLTRAVAVAAVQGERLQVFIDAADETALIAQLPLLPGLSRVTGLSGAALNLRWVRPQPQVQAPLAQENEIQRAEPVLQQADLTAEESPDV